ncbi:hypothetical protein COCON_G00101580 [Conger conger]|uniref:C2H2-type domain-containing protein n=1 Tax=Conger conger TaxID=82655 RepID=A0A9Q1DI20_CONCO|nr:hypothetical protein COCON_G00101580 [Conger conger]
MSTSFQVQVASIMEVLANTAAAEITKLVDDMSAALRLEMSRSQRENEALKTNLLLMEGELRAVRGYGERTPGNSLNLSFEVEVCDEFREAQIAKVAGKGSVSAAERVLDERSSAHLTRDDQNLPVEKRRATADVFDIKWEPVDGEQDWSESLLLSEDRLEEDPKSSQSQAEQMISEENTCGTSGAAAANDGEGPLYKEEELHMQPCPAGDPEKELQAELKQEPEEQPLTPTLPLSVDLGLELQSVWSKANNLEISQEKNRQCIGSLELVDARLDDDFSPPHYTARRPRSEKGEGSASQQQKQNGRPLYKECSYGLPDEVSAELAFPLGSTGECDGSAPCEVSSDTSAEAKSPCRTEGQEEEFICTCCGKTFPDALELKTHEEQHSAGKRFSCSECGKGFTSSSVLEKHKQKEFICTRCGKTFPDALELKTHEEQHSAGKRFSCSECGKGFTSSSVLEKHEQVHSREKPFTCSVCGKSFSQSDVLQAHKRTRAV